MNYADERMDDFCLEFDAACDVDEGAPPPDGLAHREPAYTVVKGPPGTGKTTWLLKQFKREVDERGVLPSRVALVSYSNAAADEARKRLVEGGLEVEDLKGVKTMHALCRQLLRVDGNRLLTDDHLREFRKQEFPLLGPRDAKLYESILGSASARDVPVEVVLSQLDGVNARRLSAVGFRRYAAARETFVRAGKFHTFDDLFREVLDKGLCPPADVLLVDEAQDLSPLAAKVVDLWGRRCGRVYVVGDDDQCIFSFAGADPGWFRRLYAEHGGTVLEQSYRVPRDVHDVAMGLIGQVKGRIATPYRPAPDRGEVLVGVRLEQLSELLDGESNLVLAREGWALDPVRKVLERGGRQVHARSGVQATEERRLARCAKTAQSLGLGGGAPAHAVVDLLDLRRFEADAALRRELSAWGGTQVDCAVLERLRSGSALLRDLNGDPLDALGALTDVQRALVERALAEREPPGTVVLSTFHASKGTEADVVAILPERGKASFDAGRSSPERADEELRLQYVGVTRARRRLILVAPRAGDRLALRIGSGAGR